MNNSKKLASLVLFLAAIAALPMGVEMSLEQAFPAPQSQFVLNQ